MVSILGDPNNSKKPFNYNILSCIFIYIWCAIFLISSFSIKDSGSRSFPQVVCVLAIILATGFLISSMRGHQNEKMDFSGTGRAMIMAAILLVYMIGCNFLGFYVATVIYLPVAMIYLGQRNKIVIVSLSIGLPVFVYLVFQKVLTMQIPLGIFG